MAQIKLAYIGRGSTRAPGTMASLIHQGHNFQGSEVVLIDIDESHLSLVKDSCRKDGTASWHRFEGELQDGSKCRAAGL